MSGNDSDSRYSRQQLLEEWDQTRFSEARVVIIGIGATGSVIASTLAMMGVGELVLVDMDTVELSNLSRQLLFQDTHISQFKVDAAKEILLKMNPEVKISSYNSSVQDLNPRVFNGTHVLVDGLDNFEARQYINSVSIKKKIPLVSGGIFGWWGNIQVVIPDETPCLQCQQLIPEERLKKSCTLPGEIRKDFEEEEEKFPALASVGMVIGGLMAQEVVKLILGKHEELLKEYLFWDGLKQAFTVIPLIKNPKCIVCSSKYLLEGIPYATSNQESLVDFLHRIKHAFNLEDPSFIHEAYELKMDNRQLGQIFKNGSVIYVNDKTQPSPLKLKLILED
ncbi:MAG: ThiF family adenylyltransferase [Promethearchaeota archaeon]